MVGEGLDGIGVSEWVDGAWPRERLHGGLKRLFRDPVWTS